MLPTLALLVHLTVGAAPPPLDCDKMCAKMVDACARACKAKKKKGADAKICEAQCDVATKQCQDKCKGAKAAQTNPAKAGELRKKMGLEEKHKKAEAP